MATHCTVLVNCTLARRNWCGCTSFTIDLTPFARVGSDLNTIAVHVAASVMEGWWYEGAGIYRHTRLVKRAPVHIATGGVFANPVRDAAGAWTIPTEVTLANSGHERTTCDVAVTLRDPAGAAVVE